MAKPVTEETGIQRDLYRFERKCLITELTRPEVESLLKLHPALFSEIYYERFVNNLYWDTPGRSHYEEAVEGVADRLKFRIRWYGDLWGSLPAPILEIKIKRGSVGRKELYPLVPFHLEPPLESKRLRSVFSQSDLPASLKEEITSLEPILLNRFRRKYFRSRDGNFRITVDTEIYCRALGWGGDSLDKEPSDDRTIILELKYDVEKDPLAERITQFFPFRMSKNSKYVVGLTKIQIF